MSLSLYVFLLNSLLTATDLGEDACPLGLPGNSKLSFQPVGLSFWQGCATTDPHLLRGDRYASQGEFAQAQAEYEIGWAAQQTTTDVQKQACTMDRLARNLRRLGRFARAETWAVRAFTASRTLTDLGVAAVLENNLATLYIDLRQLDKAEPLARDAAQKAEAAFGPDHADTQVMWTTLASVHAYRGDLARAEPTLRRVLFHLEKSYGLNHVEVGLAAANLADVYRSRQLPRQAIPLYLKAQTIFEQTPSVARKQILWVWSGLMLSYSRAGDRSQASALVTRTLACAEVSFAPQDPDFAAILHHAALVLSAGDHHEAAHNLMARSLSIFEGLYGPDSSSLLEPLQTYRQILRAAKDTQRTKPIESRIRQLMKGSVK